MIVQWFMAINLDFTMGSLAAILRMNAEMVITRVTSWLYNRYNEYLLKLSKFVNDTSFHYLAKNILEH